MIVKVTQPMTELDGARFMLYCENEHPDENFREMCGLLAYALMYDTKRFRHYVDMMISQPTKNIIPFYPAIYDRRMIEGKEKVGTILDGALYFG